jgi:2',3'-cyclic-nucleotide 2'-phosphodiesterase (5'-nucleotidase family)
LLSHLGIEDDEKLVRVVEGIDLIIGGHSHTKLEQPIKSENGTIILQAASSGIFLGKLDLHFKDKRLESYNYKLIPVK